MMESSNRRPLVAVLGLLVVAAGCSNKQRLPQYDFRNRSIAVVTTAPAYPEILGAEISRARSGGDALETVLNLSSALALEVSAHRAMPKLRAAATNVDVIDRMGERVLEVAARHLRAVPVLSPGTSDYEIEIRIYRYGITSSSWNSGASFLIDAELFLLDGPSGRRIWKSHVRSTSPVRPLLSSGEPAVDGVVSALALANMSTEEIQAQLELLADFSADRLLTALIDALDDTRG